MELRHLRYFDAVALEGHVHRAAARLGLAQPALTQQIKSLEREMGVRLFARAGRGIELTEAGRGFYADVQVILMQVARAVERARDVDAGKAGSIRIGFTDSASYHPLVTGTLKQFRSRWPDVDCHLEERHTDALVAAVESGGLDAAFVRPPLSAACGLVFRVLVQETLVVALPTRHPLEGRASISLAELANEPFVVYPRPNGSGLSDAVLAECRRAGFEARVAQRTPQLSSTINFVASGLGVAVVPACMRHQRQESVRSVPLSGTPLRAQLGYVVRENDARDVLANFRTLLEDVSSTTTETPSAF